MYQFLSQQLTYVMLGAMLLLVGLKVFAPRWRMLWWMLAGATLGLASGVQAARDTRDGTLAEADTTIAINVIFLAALGLTVGIVGEAWRHRRRAAESQQEPPLLSADIVRHLHQD
jgi:hypothetical protein